MASWDSRFREEQADMSTAFTRPHMLRFKIAIKYVHAGNKRIAVFNQV